MDAVVGAMLVIAVLVACFLRWRQRSKEGKRFFEGSELGGPLRLFVMFVFYIAIFAAVSIIVSLVAGDVGMSLMSWVAAKVADFRRTMNEPVTAMTRGEVFAIGVIVLIYLNSRRGT